jgi:hypothetical protein
MQGQHSVPLRNGQDVLRVRSTFCSRPPNVVKLYIYFLCTIDDSLFVMGLLQGRQSLGTHDLDRGWHQKGNQHQVECLSREMDEIGQR